MYTYTICDKMKQETIIRWVKKGYGMGKQDLLAKKYMSDNEKFADVFNYYLYNGKQVIKSENLKEESISEIALPCSE